MRAALVVLVVLVAIGFILSRVSANEYEITPGGAQPVAPIISIEGHSAPKTNGQILLTDVYLTQLTWLPAKLDSDAQIVPASALVDPGVSISELNAQGYLQMAQAKDAAKYAALTRLGYHVTSKPSGAIVEAVGEHTPAAGASLSSMTFLANIANHGFGMCWNLWVWKKQRIGLCVNIQAG